MKLKNTLILLILVAGVLAYVKWYDWRIPSREEKMKSEIKPFQCDQDKVTQLTIRNRDVVVQFSQTDRVWRMEAPLKDRAQDFDLKKLLGQLEDLKLERVSNTPPTKDQLKVYGLLKPEFSVKVQADKPLEISFGNETARVERFGNETAKLEQYYVKVEGSEYVHMATTSVREMLSRKVDEWRSRTLSDVLPQNVQKVNIKTAKGEIEIAKAGRYWSLTKPLKARADLAKVSDFISNALTAQVREFIPEGKDLGTFGLIEPRATLTFTAEGSDEPAVLQIGAARVDKKEEPKPGDKKGPAKAGPKESETTPVVYVKMTGREGVVTVPATIESLVQVDPNDLRDRNLMRIQEATVNRITIETPGHDKIVLEKTLGKDLRSEDWVRKVDAKTNVPANAGAAGKLLTTLATGQVARFVANMSSELKGFGLDQPSVIVTVGDYASEGTPETAPGEREQGKLLLGRADGDAVFAKLAEEPFIFAVRKSLLDEVWTDPVQWNSPQVLELKREDIVALEIQRTGQPPINLVADKEKGWKLAKGDAAVSQVAVGSLVNTVAGLRAVRWEGATVATHGLEKPNLVVTVTLADKKNVKVSIGSVTPDEYWYGTLEATPGTFLMSKPDFDSLNAALLEAPKPAAEASPGTPGAPGAVASKPAAGVVAPAVTVPPAADPVKPVEAAKPTEAPANGAKPAPESMPKTQ
jgi:hypothetical protein